MSKKFLVVDDDPGSRELLGLFLKLGGHEVIQVANGREAWALLNGGEMFDHIFSDYEMPCLNGLQLLRRLREDERFSEAPFALMSGRPTVSNEDFTDLGVATARFGATFWSKPIDFESMLNALGY